MAWVNTDMCKFMLHQSVLCSETRYLLFLTENYSALRILQQTDLLDHDPLILFGSSFPEDLNYTQVIKKYVFTGICIRPKVL